MNRNTCIPTTQHLSHSASQAMRNGLDFLKRWWAIQLLKLSIAEERRRLATLDARELKDMGIHPADAQLELQRSFNDIPADRIPKRHN